MLAMQLQALQMLCIRCSYPYPPIYSTYRQTVSHAAMVYSTQLTPQCLCITLSISMQYKPVLHYKPTPLFSSDYNGCSISLPRFLLIYQHAILATSLSDGTSTCAGLYNILLHESTYYNTLILFCESGCMLVFSSTSFWRFHKVESRVSPLRTDLPDLVCTLSTCAWGSAIKLEPRL